MKRALLLIAVAAGLAACSDATNTAASQLNLNRPIDVAFGCYGALRLTGGGSADPSQMVALSAQPLASCDVRSGTHDTGTPTPRPMGQEVLTNVPKEVDGALDAVAWYAFILQSVPGTVSLQSFPTQPAGAFTGGDISPIDADPLTPGQNGISVGEDPVGIATDKVGCYEITANAGSCDLSELDIASALDSEPGARVDRYPVKNASGQTILARPAAIVAEPPSGAIGVTCPMQGSGLVYIAYPSCHLVAAVDASNGTIVGGVQYDASGTPTILPDGNVSCPAECGSGAAITPGARPVALDLRLENDAQAHREVLAIGADNSHVLAVVDLDPATSLPMSLQPIALEDKTGTLGVISVAITPQIGMGGRDGVLNDDNTATGGQSQFVYAVATDASVRVADILSVRKECDAEVDPRFLHDNRNVKQMSCMPVGDPTTPPRRPGARTPGIELTGDGIPTSVNVYTVPDHMGGDPGPTNLVGHFGVITASSGGTFLFNIDDDFQPDFVDATAPSLGTLGTEIPFDIAHQLRDSIPDRGALSQEQIGTNEEFTCDNPGPAADTNGVFSEAGARATAAPTLLLPPGGFAAEKVDALPSIRQQLCVGADEPQGKPVSDIVFSASVVTRDLTFPDTRGLRGNETWTLTWEGPLSNDVSGSAIDGPQIREGQIYVDAAGMRLDDPTHPFCDAGVEPFDILQVRGCDPSVGDANCPIGYTCYVHPQSQVAGIGACMLTSEADRLSNACKEYLLTQRTYTIGKTTTGELALLPRKHELSTTPLDGCTSDAQCKSLADYALQLHDSLNPVDDRMTTDTHTYVCALDPDRAPLVKFPGLTNSGKRCIETCTDDSSCSTGTVCQGGFCMEGIVPPQACVNAPQRFELAAGDAFEVLGTLSGYVHPVIADANGNCVKDVAAPLGKVGRIPLAPHDAAGNLAQCDPTADPRTGQRPDGTFEPNPCWLTTDETELDPVYVAGSCTLANPGSQIVTRSTDAIKFRNRGMTLIMVDPTYPGDAMCIGDRAGGLQNVPIVPFSTQLSFQQVAGFLPMSLQIAPALPVKVVRGPQESIWVIDEGDYLSTSISLPSTRGKVFRVEPSDLNVINTVQ